MLKRQRGRLLAILISASSLASCGPELTDAATIDISGHWVGQNPVGGISGIEVDLVQSTDGSLKGVWSGKSVATGAACPADLGSSPTNKAYGHNTAIEVDFELLGAGHFDGQLNSLTMLTGSVLSCGMLFPEVFVRTGPAAQNILPR